MKVSVQKCGNPERCQVEIDVRQAIKDFPEVKVFCLECLRSGRAKTENGQVVVEMHQPLVKELTSLARSLVFGITRKLF